MSPTATASSSPSAAVVPPTPQSATVLAKPPRVSAIAWTADDELGHRQWLAEGRRIGVMSRCSAWWIGDWLLYGTARWGEMFTEAAKVTGYDPKSLRNMRYVASRFQLSLRKDNLTFSHHALLAGFEPDAQRQWLARAVADRMSVEDLRIELRTARRQTGASSSAAALSNSTQPRQSRHLQDSSKQSPSVIVCPHCGEGIPVA
jgi:hypothetical protein